MITYDQDTICLWCRFGTFELLWSPMYSVFLLLTLLMDFIVQGNRRLHYDEWNFFHQGALLSSNIFTYASVLLLSALCVIMYCLNVLPYIFLQTSITFYNSTCIRMLIWGPYVLGIPNFGPTLSFLYFVRLLFVFTLCRNNIL